MVNIEGLIEIITMMAITIILGNPQAEWEGSISRYDNGVMERVIDWREENNIPYEFKENEEAIPIATLWCSQVGKHGELTVIVDGENVGTYLVQVADCASSWHTRTISWMTTSPIVGEISYQGYDQLGLWDTGGWGRLVLNE